MNVRVNPTATAYEKVTLAYNWFNSELFGGKLPPCLITFQRHAKAYGYFASKRFGKAYNPAPNANRANGGLVDEIALNPKHFGGDRTAAKVLSTLAHEMCHLEQAHFGKEPTRCYHDKQWAGMMKAIGLQPSSTGAPGGKETGPKVSHYILEGGPFAKACERFLEKHGDAWLYQDVWQTGQRSGAKGKGKGGGEGEGEGEGEGAAKSKGRIKFQCKGCELNCWAKPSAKLRCVPCDRPMQPTESATVGGDDDESED